MANVNDSPNYIYIYIYIIYIYIIYVLGECWLYSGLAYVVVIHSSHRRHMSYCVIEMVCFAKIFGPPGTVQIVQNKRSGTLVPTLERWLYSELICMSGGSMPF